MRTRRDLVPADSGAMARMATVAVLTPLVGFAVLTNVPAWQVQVIVVIAFGAGVCVPRATGQAIGPPPTHPSLRARIERPERLERARQRH